MLRYFFSDFSKIFKMIQFFSTLELRRKRVLAAICLLLLGSATEGCHAQVSPFSGEKGTQVAVPMDTITGKVRFRRA